MTTEPPNVQRILGRPEVAAMFGTSTKTIDRLIKLGRFPAPDVVLSRKTVRWSAACIDRFLGAHN